MLTYINNYLEGFSRRSCLLLSLAGSLLLGLFDYLIGPDLSFSVFYLGPIMLAGWYGGRAVGFILVVVSSLLWLSADLAAGSFYTNWLIPVWNTFVRLSFFVIILWLLLVTKMLNEDVSDWESDYSIDDQFSDYEDNNYRAHTARQRYDLLMEERQLRELLDDELYF